MACEAPAQGNALFEPSSGGVDRALPTLHTPAGGAGADGSDDEGARERAAA